jgi:hypothetical protein
MKMQSKLIQEATSLKTCKVQYLNTKELEVNVALVRTSDYFIYDWDTLGFVENNPVQGYYPLFLHSPLLEMSNFGH